MANNNTLVLGIGNTLLSDEGVGVRMLAYLQDACPDLPHVDFLDGGTLSFTLAAWIEEADNLVVIDAAQLDSAPGTAVSYTHLRAHETKTRISGCGFGV